MCFTGNKIDTLNASRAWKNTSVYPVGKSKLYETRIEMIFTQVPTAHAVRSSFPLFILIDIYAGATRSANTMSTPAIRTELVTVAANEIKKSISFQIPFVLG